MKIVSLKCGALLTVSDARRVRRPNSRNFTIYALDSKGGFKNDSMVPVRDVRSVSRKQFYPAYYGLDIHIKLKPGIYMITAGDYPARYRYFSVSPSGHVIMGIPDPKINSHQFSECEK